MRNIHTGAGDKSGRIGISRASVLLSLTHVGEALGTTVLIGRVALDTGRLLLDREALETIELLLARDALMYTPSLMLVARRAR